MNERDDLRHAPGAEPSWNEWWDLAYADDDGFGGIVRLALFPNRRVAWYWAYVVLPDAPGPIVVRDHEVPYPRQDWLEVRADGLWAECTCETPFEHWTYGLEAFAVRLDDPRDALRGEIGDRLPVGLDLEWELRSPVVAPAPAARYVQLGGVHGEVLLDRERVTFEGSGTRAHGWDAEDPFAPGSARAAVQLRDDLAVVVDGERASVWRGGAVPDDAEGARIETHVGADGFPASARIVVDHALEVDVEVLALVPVPIDADRHVVRALCRFVVADGGAAGNGWMEWCPTRAQ